MIEQIGALSGKWPDCALTLGNFDGVHLGHQCILREIVQEARARKVAAVGITFEPHPVRYFKPESPPFRLSTPSQKSALLTAHGLDEVVFIGFDERLSAYEPDQFVSEVIRGVFQPSLVVVGHDFNFARDRKGTPWLLRDLGAREGFEVRVCEPLKLEGQVISSSRIRGTLGAGDVVSAARMLGRHYSLVGEVVHGLGRGRELGFPTANLATDSELLPAHGVYATWFQLGTERWPAITNIGVRPTFDGQGVSVETHILGDHRLDDLDLYGQNAAVHMVERIREERRFEGVTELIAAIKIDLEICRRIHSNLHSLEQSDW